MPMQVLPVGGIYTAIEEEKRRKLEEARRKELEERAKKEGGCPTCCQKVREGPEKDRQTDRQADRSGHW